MLTQILTLSSALSLTLNLHEPSPTPVTEEKAAEYLSVDQENRARVVRELRVSIARTLGRAPHRQGRSTTHARRQHHMQGVVTAPCVLLLCRIAGARGAGVSD